MLTQKERDYQETIRKLQDIDLRCLRRPSRISRIAACVPKPCNPLPADPLPRWEHLPLDQKFPMVPSPEGQFRLSRSGVGDSLFKCNPSCNGFDTKDPYIRGTPIRYEPLHDPNLRSYYRKHPRVLRNLERKGFIYEDGKVLCSIKDFNRYREYLSRIHGTCVDRERERQDTATEADYRQFQNIKKYILKQANDMKQEKIKQRQAACKAQEARRQLAEQLKEMGHPSVTYREKLAKERAYAKKRREYLRKQRNARIDRMRKAERQKHQKMVLEWYCRDIYKEQLRKSLMDYKKRLHEAELNEFIRNKREYQCQKLRYERAILIRQNMEANCQINKRRDYYANLESSRKDRVKRKAEARQAKLDRELYLMRKYGRRWLTIVAEKRKKHTTYHDSLWHIRHQLRQMVDLLREESGAMNFTSFIQGLVALKPGREIIQMDDETKDVIYFIISLILERAYKEYIRKTTSCSIDFLCEETRKQMAGGRCSSDDPLLIEDFIPPTIRKRFRPLFPYEKPLWPCSGPCADLKRAQGEDDADWRKRCCEMAQALTDVHTEISNYLMDRMCRVLENQLCTDVKAACRAPKKKKKPKTTCEEICRYDELCEKANYFADEEIQRLQCIKKRSSSLLAQKMTNKALCKASCGKGKLGSLIKKASNRSTTSSNNSGSSNIAESMVKEAILKSAMSLNTTTSCASTCAPDSAERPVSNESDGSGSSILAERMVKTAIANSRVDSSVTEDSGEGTPFILNDDTGSGDLESLEAPQDLLSDGAMPIKAVMSREQLIPVQSSKSLQAIDSEETDDGLPPSLRSKPDVSDEGQDAMSRDGGKMSDPFSDLDGLKSSDAASGEEGPTTFLDATSGEEGPTSTDEVTGDEGPYSTDGVTGEDEHFSTDEVAGDEGPYSTDGVTGEDGPFSTDEVAGDEGPYSTDGITGEDGPFSTDEVAGDEGPYSTDGVTGEDGPFSTDEMSGEDGVPQSLSKALGGSSAGPEPGDHDPIASSSSVLGVKSSPSLDVSWVSQVIEEERRKLQREKDVVSSGDECAIDDISNDENLSRIASFMTIGSICHEAKALGEPCPPGQDENQKSMSSPSERALAREPSEIKSDMSFVDRIVKEQRDLLQKEKDIIGTGDEAEIDKILNECNMSRVASGMVRKSVCDEIKEKYGLRPIASYGEGPLSVVASSNMGGMVERIIEEQRNSLSSEDRPTSVVYPQGSVSSIASSTNVGGMVDRIIEEQRNILLPQDDFLLPPPAVTTTDSNRFAQSSSASSNVRMVDKIIDDQRKSLQQEIEMGGDSFQVQNVQTEEQPHTSAAGAQPYLDPNEDGISPVRSEIRLHLNIIREELDNLKAQLIGQGILKPPDDPGRRDGSGRQ